MSSAPEELRGIASELHHVAIVVRSLAESRGAWEALGLSAGEPEFVEDQDVNVLICECGGQRIELVEPASDSSPVSGFLEKRGPGLHHLAFEVADCAAAIDAARARPRAHRRGAQTGLSRHNDRFPSPSRDRRSTLRTGRGPLECRKLGRPATLIKAQETP